MNITFHRAYVLGVVGYVISALWMFLAATTLIAMAGAAGIGVSAGSTRLPELLAGCVVAAVVVAFATMRRQAAIVVAVASAIVAVLIIVGLNDWHPDYRQFLQAAAVLSVASAAWGTVTFTRPSGAKSLR